MISFAEARRLAVRRMAQAFPLETSFYAAATVGVDDGTHWHVTVGDFRHVVMGDPRFRREGMPVVLVAKDTGVVTMQWPDRGAAVRLPTARVPHEGSVEGSGAAARNPAWGVLG